MHPVLFYIGNFPIPTFGLMVALGFLFAIRYAVRAARRIPVADARIYDLAFLIMVAALVGSRIAYILVEWETFLDRPFSLIFSREGYVFYGGFVASAATVILFARLRGLPLWKLADALAPAVALGHVFGRLGCFLNGCCYGRMCSVYSPLTRFPRVLDPQGHLVGSPPFVEQYHEGLVRIQDLLSLPVHPTQLYEATGLLVLFAVLHRLYWRTRWTPGMVFLIYVVSYAALRFVIEFFRGDWRGWIITGWLSTSQGIALVALLIAPVAFMLLRKQERLSAAPHKPSTSAGELKR